MNDPSLVSDRDKIFLFFQRLLGTVLPVVRLLEREADQFRTDGPVDNVQKIVWKQTFRA
jgi:hypothetical protein